MMIAFDNPKRCACGASYNAAGWADLKYKGRMRQKDAPTLELRDCVCGSTLAVEVPKKAKKQAKVITTSAARCFRGCPRKYFWRYEKGLQPRVEAEALRFGTLVHEALAAWWQRKPYEWPAAADAFEVAKAKALLVGYDSRWSLDGYDVESVEQTFDIPLCRGWRLQGKRDAVVRKDGRRVVEHKTSSVDIGPGSDYQSRLSLDTQCSLYLLEGGFDGVIYDILKKPALRPLKESKKRDAPETADEYFARCVEAIAEAPDEYYQRAEVVRLDGELADAKADLIATVRAIELCAKQERWPRNDDNCLSYSTRCQYWSLCTNTGSEADFAVSTEQHPELKE